MEINVKVKQVYAKDFINETNKNKISNEFLKKCRESALLFKKGEDNMKKSDLKNGMSYKNRNGEMFYIINDKVFVKADVITLRYHRELYQELVYYDEDFKWSSDKKWDIMEIYDCDNKLIWERKEVDWSKIPVDTKVLVRNSQDQEWECRYFAKYEDEKVYTFIHGATSWSSWSTGELSSVISWKYAKLVENKKVKNENIEDIENQFAEYCKGKRCATECGYYGSLSCILAWVLDNYNVSPKQEV